MSHRHGYGNHDIMELPCWTVLHSFNLINQSRDQSIQVLDHPQRFDDPEPRASLQRRYLL